MFYETNVEAELTLISLTWNITSGVKTKFFIAAPLSEENRFVLYVIDEKEGK